MSHQRGPLPPPLVRAPLAPFPPGVYDQTLPVPLPSRPTLSYYRGNFCGLHVQGAPVVPGCNASNPETIMACLLDNYPSKFQDDYLDRYAGCYTHLQRSLGHALYYGKTLNQYIELSQRAIDRGLFCDHWLLNGGEAQNSGLKVQNRDGAYWKPILDPIIDALLSASVVDTACVGWQFDQQQQDAPGNATISIIAYVAEALPRTIPLYTHWVNEALAWWKTGGEVWSDQYQTLNVNDRFTWWHAMQPYLTGGYYQGNTTTARTDMQLFQDRIKDTLDPMCGMTGKGTFGQSWRGGTKPFSLIGFEVTGQDQFDGSCSEDEGDLVGYLVSCTTSFNGMGMGGYGNGGRQPSGKVL